MIYSKIRINCTSQKDLTINNKKITINNYNKYSSELNDDKIISRVSLLFEDNFHHKDINFINKTLEFHLNIDITREDFELFIENLHNLGYKSNRKFPKIQYFNKAGFIEFNYNFNTMKPFEKNSINNIYHKQHFYVKQNQN